MTARFLWKTQRRRQHRPSASVRGFRRTNKCEVTLPNAATAQQAPRKPRSHRSIEQTPLNVSISFSHHTGYAPQANPFATVD